jgi:hypothetical protein
MKGSLYSAECVLYEKLADYPSGDLRIGKPFFNSAPWPIWQMMWVERFKLLYTPIAKNACTSLKSLMVKLSSDVVETEVPGGQVHGWLDNTNSGLQLGDLQRTRMEEILSDPKAARVVVVRNPFDRLVSAYLEKFVANRMDPGSQFHTRTVVTAMQSCAPNDEPDFEASITFREFVEYIVSGSPENLDPHWCPQSRYLAGIDFQWIYDVDDLRPLLVDLERLGVPEQALSLPLHNRNRGEDRVELTGAMDLPANRLANRLDVATSSFFDARLSRLVRACFADDFALWSRV